MLFWLLMLHAAASDSSRQHQMTSWPLSQKCDIMSKLRLCQSVLTYLKNNLDKVHPDLI